jgi:hypothetical protein
MEDDDDGFVNFNQEPESLQRKQNKAAKIMPEIQVSNLSGEQGKGAG